MGEFVLHLRESCFYIYGVIGGTPNMEQCRHVRRLFFFIFGVCMYVSVSVCVCACVRAWCTCVGESVACVSVSAAKSPINARRIPGKIFMEASPALHSSVGGQQIEYRSTVRFTITRHMHTTIF